MASELLIRPSLNDHRMLEDLLAPSANAIVLPSQRPLVTRLVLDAQTAAQRPQFVATAQTAGVPVLVDPLTPLLQGALRERDPWASLPFGQSAEVSPDHLSSKGARRSLIANVVAFELEHGATGIIPPYPYVDSTSDPWFIRALQLIHETARYLREEGRNLPIVPILCASLQGFGPARNWKLGLDRFARTALDVGPQLVGLSLSPIRARDKAGKVGRLFASYRHVKQLTGTRVIAMRQGFFGPGLVAAGLDGYETGIGTAEFCDVRRSIRSRKPREKGKSRGGAFAGVYLDPLGRSVPISVADALLRHPNMKAKLGCMNRHCCPKGPASTLEHRREHTIRSRAQALAILDGMPHMSWRLHQIAKDALLAADLAEQSNGVLAAESIDQTLRSDGPAALAQVAEHLRIADLGLEAA